MKHSGWILLLLLAFLTGCSAGNTEYAQSGDGVSSTTEILSPYSKEETEQEAENMEKKLILMVDDAEVPVVWEKNPSVAEMTEYAARKAIPIEMSMYGGWEQVGSLGYSISRKDVQMTALPGDIMLYSGNQIVLFYGENSWAYTKLGHITLPEEEVTNLLSRSAVRITLAVQ